MSLPSITTVVALDEKHLDQWRLTWRTWKKFRPILIKWPLLVIADAFAGTRRWWHRRLKFLGHPHRNIILWDWPNLDDTSYQEMSQRERMLTAVVKVAPIVETDYWCKLDTDAIALDHSPWPLPQWFARNPAIVAPPWAYTKPARYLYELEDWAANIDGLKQLPPLDLPPDKRQEGTIRYKRICSWCAFFDTLWTRSVADYVPSRLPVPSQDTYHWYVAQRQDELIAKVNMKKHGWTNMHTRKSRENLVAEVMRCP
jgi:hypothetical protein